LKKKADLRVFNASEDYALHEAVRNGHISIVKYFLENGMTLDDENDDDENLLEIAVNSGQVQMASYLIETKEMDLSEITENSQYLLDVVKNGFVDMARFLIVDKHMDINTKNEDGYSLLEIAAKKGNVEMVRYLANEIPSTVETFKASLDAKKLRQQ